MSPGTVTRPPTVTLPLTYRPMGCGFCPMALAVLNEFLPAGLKGLCLSGLVGRWPSAAAEPLSSAPLSTTTERVFLPG
jgi:hypothetical protein